MTLELDEETLAELSGDPGWFKKIDLRVRVDAKETLFERSQQAFRKRYKYQIDPDFRARTKQNALAYYYAHRSVPKPKRPKQDSKYQRDPVYREMIRAKALARYHATKHLKPRTQDPKPEAVQRRSRARTRMGKKYATDPVLREKMKAAALARYYRLKAAKGAA